MNERDVFIQALHVADPAQRAEVIYQLCAGDELLRCRVEGLLAAYDKAESFLEVPAGAIQQTINQPISEVPGAQIGPYKLLEQIGEGGMGAVYMADQQAPVRRRVALKIIKPGMDTRQVIARFEAERQALALMDHSSIARVLDAGSTESGRPYFVMELVRGVPITDYCDTNNLSVLDRLELFVQVCQAVQHAHQKGIIHRDIKPSNVLVTLDDGRPVPKVIDFGVAKAINQQLTEKTLFTSFSQMIGTPLYMSPEQAEMTSLDVDTRSDIYSLGVLLYELLTGTTPFDQKRFREAALDEIRRIIREEEPPKPSTRASTLGEARTATAAHRRTDPNRLSQLLRGDLDWIVMKSLEKDRARRYETANGLARDIERYLQDQPVEARPPSAVYRFRKFARRNRVGLAVALLVSTTLVAGTMVSTWQAVRASRAESIAEAERREAEANSQKARMAVDKYFTQVSESKLLDVPGLQPLRMELLKTALDFYRGFADEHVHDPAVLADLAVTYLRFAEINHANDRNDDAVAAIDQALAVIDRLRREFPEARDQHRRMAGYWTGNRQMQVSTAMPKDPQAAFQSINRLIENWQALAEENLDVPAFRRDLAALYHRTGDLLESGGQTAEAAAYFMKAIVVLESLTHERPETPAYRADLAACYEYLARVGRKEEAESNMHKALVIRERLVAESPDVPQYQAELALSLTHAAKLAAVSDPDEADKLYRRAIKICERLIAASPSVPMHFKRWSDAQNGLVDLLAKTGRRSESEAQNLHAAQFMRELELDNPGEALDIAIADSTFYRAQSLSESGQHQQALPLFQKAAAVYERAAEKPDSPAVVRFLLGHCYRYMDGLDNNRKAVTIFAKLASEDPSTKDYQGCLSWAESGLGYELAKERDFTAAEACYRHAIELDHRLVAEDHGNLQRLAGLARNQQSYGDMLVAAGRAEEAVAAHRAAAEIYVQLKKDSPQKNEEPTKHGDH